MIHLDIMKGFQESLRLILFNVLYDKTQVKVVTCSLSRTVSVNNKPNLSNAVLYHLGSLLHELFVLVRLAVCPYLSSY